MRKNGGTLIGKSFNRLTCLEYFGKSQNKRSRYRCKCTCGKEVIVTSSSLASGNTKSCGCLKLEELLKRSTTHGYSTKCPYYKLWLRIKYRCNNPKNKWYRIYGGKGIKIYKEWNSNFLLFREYILNNLGPQPSSNYSLDRIDGNKDYCPGNIRWATDSTQMWNSVKPKKSSSGYRGVYKTPRNTYRVIISKSRKPTNIGVFKSLPEAVEAYKKACLEIYGELPPEYR